jgi:hypothetical protein
MRTSFIPFRAYHEWPSHFPQGPTTSHVTTLGSSLQHTNLLETNHMQTLAPGTSCMFPYLLWHDSLNGPHKALFTQLENQIEQHPWSEAQERQERKQSLTFTENFLCSVLTIGSPAMYWGGLVPNFISHKSKCQMEGGYGFPREVKSRDWQIKSPWAKPCPLPVFMNSIFQGHSYTHK